MKSIAIKAFPVSPYILPSLKHIRLPNTCKLKWVCCYSIYLTCFKKIYYVSLQVNNRIYRNVEMPITCSHARKYIFKVHMNHMYCSVYSAYCIAESQSRSWDYHGVTYLEKMLCVLFLSLKVWAWDEKLSHSWGHIWNHMMWSWIQFAH